MIDSAQEYIDENINKKEKMDFTIKLLKPKEVVKNIKCPILYVYSENDTIVNQRHSKILYELSNHPKRIISVKGYNIFKFRDHNCQRDKDTKGIIIDYLLQMSLK